MLVIRINPFTLRLNKFHYDTKWSYQQEDTIDNSADKMHLNCSLIITLMISFKLAVQGLKSETKRMKPGLKAV